MPTPPGTRRWIAIGIAVAVVVAAGVAIGVRAGRTDTSDTNSSVTPTSSGARFTISARGLQTNATIEGLRVVTIDGGATMTIPGRLGADQQAPAGQVVVTGNHVTMRASDIEMAGELLIRPNEVVLRGPTSVRNLKLGGRTTLSGDHIAYTLNGRTTTFRASLVFHPSGFGTITASGTKPRWIDPPSELSLSESSRTYTSWAGTGTVTVGGQSFTNEFGALSATELVGTVNRASGKVRASGRARAQQVYLDGAPQLMTKASVDLVQIREETAAGRRLELTWAPRNVGDFDMLITTVRTMSPAAGWMSLGLQPAPNEFGGETRNAIGGQTPGFQHGGAIRSLLSPGDADRRDITVTVPGGTPPGTYDLSVSVEGNFAPVTVPFEVIVR